MTIPICDSMTSHQNISIQKQNTIFTYPSKPFLRLSGLHFHPRAEFAVLSSFREEESKAQRERETFVSHIEYQREKRDEIQSFENLGTQKE